MNDEAIDLLLAIVEFLFYPHELSSDHSKKMNLLQLSEAFRKKVNR